MHFLLNLPLAAAAGKTEPLFGNQWLAIAVILVGITVFMMVIAVIGRWLAATHPDAPAPAPAPSPVTVADEGIPPQIFAAIAAAVYATLGQSVHIISAQHQLVAVQSSEEDARHQWAAEGRRQIYSSHRLR